MRFSEVGVIRITIAEATSLLATVAGEIGNRRCGDAKETSAQGVDLVEMMAAVAHQYRAFVLGLENKEA